MREPTTSRALTPAQWGARLGDGFATPLRPLDGGMLRRWAGSAALMEQPPLDHHYLALHLGGAKRVHRQGEGPTMQRDVRCGATTLVPAGAAYRWMTQGPIAFAHLYIHPRRIARTVAEVFDRDPAAVRLLDGVGIDDPLAEALLTAMLEEGDGPDARLALDSLFDALLVRLVRRRTTLGTAPPARHRLAPARLRAVKEHVAAHLDDALSLDALAAVAGVSRFHFCRSFREATGLPPAAYVLRERVALARRLLRGGDERVEAVARRCGFNSAAQFSAAFRRVAGCTPSQWRAGG